MLSLGLGFFVVGGGLFVGLRWEGLNFVSEWMK